MKKLRAKILGSPGFLKWVPATEWGMVYLRQMYFLLSCVVTPIGLIQREIQGTGFMYYAFCVLHFLLADLIFQKFLARSSANICLWLNHNQLKCSLVASLPQGCWLWESYRWNQETGPAPFLVWVKTSIRVMCGIWLWSLALGMVK